MKTFFTSDHHFSHANIIKLCKRPFSSVEEMDEEMIRRWNSVVTEEDEVYYLGDLTLQSEGIATGFLRKLNFHRIYMIEGNHDKRWYPYARAYGDFNYYRINSISSVHEISIDGKHIVLCHYPMREWNRAYRGSYHLFGHSHGTMPPYGYSFDVGVDCWNFYPVSFEQVVEKMNTLKPAYPVYNTELSL